MVVRVHGHHLLLGLRLNNYHNNQFSLYSRQTESVKSGKEIIGWKAWPLKKENLTHILEPIPSVENVRCNYSCCQGYAKNN
jgi:hypothetical protein